MFDTTKDDLKDILKKVEKGELQLPDFQRDYVWGDDDVRSLVASIAKGFPVGALLTLEMGGAVAFKPRLLEGVPKKTVSPDELLLDGQQRITSLYQATQSKEPVRTRSNKNKEVLRFYYIDIKAAVSEVADIEDAIIGLPAERILRTDFGRTVTLDLSTRELEFENDMFPLNQVFDSRDWFYDWRDYWKKKDRDVSELDRSFVRGIVDAIERYKMPIIRLDKANSREAICLVFEKVNVGGKKLDAFELVTAIFAASNFDLREDWNGKPGVANVGRRARMIGSPNHRDVLSQLASTDFLQAVSLLHTRENRLAKEQDGKKDKELPQISCRREALLGLPLTAFQKHADAIEKGFIEAGGFLNEQKIIWHKDIPYPPQTVGLASVFAILGKEANTVVAKEQLAQWFWSVALGELYGSGTDTKLARDVPELVAWIASKGTQPRPKAIDDAIFQADRLDSLRIRLSSAYKGLHVLLMRQGCRDFITGRGADLMTFFNDKVDIHHIFPKAWCKAKGIPPSVFDSIINKTPLSRDSNTSVGGDAPSIYLARIEAKQKITSAALDAILTSHLINPKHLRADNFDAFYAERKKALSGLVAGIMKKPVVEEHGSNEVETDIVAAEPENEEVQETA